MKARQTQPQNIAGQTRVRVLAKAASRSRVCTTARAGNRRFWLLSALRAHTKAPYKTDLHRKTLMALNRPGAARTGV
jgi:hypothetical protein